MKKVFLLVIISMHVLCAPAQNKAIIDSLQNVVNGNSHDTIKIIALNELGMNYYLFDLGKAKDYWDQQLEYINRSLNKSLKTKEKKFYSSSKANAFGCIAYVYQSWGNLDSAIIFSDSCMALAKQIGDMETLASALNNLGVIHNYKGDIASALKCYEISYQLQDSLGSKKGAAMAINNIALIYRSQGDISKALNYHIKSLKISEEIKDAFSMGHAYNNIGVIYREQGEFKKGMEYFHKSYSTRKSINDLNGMALALNEIGVGFTDKRQYDSAFYYHQKSLEFREQLRDSTYIAQSLVNIGNIFVGEKKYDKALEYFNKALLLKKITQEQQGIADAMGHIGGTYYLMKQYKKAEEYTSKALEIAQKLKNPSEIERACEKLSKIFAEQGKYKQAYDMQVLFKQMSDSIFNERNRKETYKQQLKYDFEKKAVADSVEYASSLKIKDLELAKKEEQTQKQKVIIYSFVFGFIIILIFSIVIYRLFIQKKKANILLEIRNAEILQKSEEITSQRDEIEAQRDEITKHRDIILVQKNNIEDSINYAKRIQDAVLPSAEQTKAILGEHFIIFKPKDIVSGDFYWATALDNILVVAVADCTGHGVPGAFMSMWGISFLNEIVRKQEIKTANIILNELRKEIINALHQKGSTGEQKDGMDIALVVINKPPRPPEGGEIKSPIRDFCLPPACPVGRAGTVGVMYDIQFAGANNPLYVVKKRSSLQEAKPLEETKGDKMPIAIYERMDPFTNHEIQINKGDTLYLTSDGYEDQFGGPNNKKFKGKQLKELLVSIAEKPMNEQKNILESSFACWKGEHEQVDDITILGIKV